MTDTTATATREPLPLGRIVRVVGSHLSDFDDCLMGYEAIEHEAGTLTLSFTRDEDSEAAEGDDFGDAAYRFAQVPPRNPERGETRAGSLMLGLAIFATYADRDQCAVDVAAEHDVIYAGPSAGIVSAEDRRRLEELGWHLESDGEGFALFV